MAEGVLSDISVLSLEQATTLNIRLAWTSRGDSRQLVEAVAEGFATLQERLAGRDPSAHTYLHIEGFDELRVQVHRCSRMTISRTSSRVRRSRA